MRAGFLLRRGAPAIAAVSGGTLFIACEGEVRRAEPVLRSALMSARAFPVSTAPTPASVLQARHFRTHTASGWAPERKYKVGVLGATGAVGQRFIQYLEGHPWFEVTRLGASERSEGKAYEKAANWGVSANVPDFVRGMRVVSVDPKDYGGEVDLVFSALVSARSAPCHRRPPSNRYPGLLTHRPCCRTRRSPPP